MLTSYESKIVLILSGKRKSGKDHLADLLNKNLGSGVSAIIRLSGPLKYAYAKHNDVPYDKLLDSSAFKEKYRAAMIKYGQDIRLNDPYQFCRSATAVDGSSDTPVWIVSDARYITDLSYFALTYPDSLIIKARIVASEATRKGRGWVYTPGIDDIASECELDSGIHWDLVIQNDNPDIFKQCYDKLLNLINSRL